MGFLEVLTLVFVTLKLLEVGAVADWSWWWVFSPLWIGYGLALIWGFFVLVIGAVMGTRRL